jgi:hypothetical protein
MKLSPQDRPGYSFPYTPKALHELFCYSQTYLPDTDQGNYFRNALQDLLTTLEKHRPLGHDGKHNSLHTETCGCEDQ